MKILVLLIAFLFAVVSAVKHSDWKTCSQSGFCARNRAFADLRDAGFSELQTTLVLSSIQVNNADNSVTADLVRAETNILYSLVVHGLNLDSLRITIQEKTPLSPVYSIGNDHDYVFLPSSSLPSNHFKLVKRDTSTATISLSANHTLLFHAAPFRLQILQKGVHEPLIDFNAKNYFYYEHRRNKEDDAPPETPESVELNVQDGEGEANAAPQETTPPPELSEDEKRTKDLLNKLKYNLWAESFGNSMDSKPKGPSSIGFDITFSSKHIYGLPQHASSYSLKATRGANAPYSEPFKLYNGDVFEYEVDNPMALYGSVPFVLSHNVESSVGVLWMNAAEMWVDVEKAEKSVSTHWTAESGILDLLVFLGPDPRAIANQLTTYTGRPILPQHFAIAYHQCRWNYLDQQDVHEVDSNFDKFDIPYDVMWLDIEHTEGKRYFTWDKVKFPEPVKMQDELAVKGRKLVTIVDPHLKQDASYPVSKKAQEAGWMVKKNDGNDFEGWCWPGTSYWLDYLNPDARRYWAEQFNFTVYEGSTINSYTWNDMNEPSVFSGPEITMPKDNLHFGEIEHRDVHNIYGTLQHRSTAEGHLLRSDYNDRPFVLSRAFFIGAQRYGAVWTGDNTASWEMLAISTPMILSISISGVTFCGADVGGFFGNPDAELLLRWYQVGAYQPFFRAHAHIDSKRREPWLFGEPYTTLIREAIRARYRLLPYFYTLFWESNQNGLPVMRPLMYEFPKDEETFGIDEGFMAGSSLLVWPVVTQGSTSVEAYLPVGSNWYEYDTLKSVQSGRQTVTAPLEKIPVFIRGGSIIPRRDRIRRSSNLSLLQDPYTLIIALDSNGNAEGQLYVDDGHSYNHVGGEFLVTKFTYRDGVLRAENLGAAGINVSNVRGEVVKVKSTKFVAGRVERVVIVGRKGSNVKSVSTEGSAGKKRLEFRIEENGVVIVKDPKVVIGEEWQIIVA